MCVLLCQHLSSTRRQSANNGTEMSCFFFGPTVQVDGVNVETHQTPHHVCVMCVGQNNGTDAVFSNVRKIDQYSFCDYIFLSFLVSFADCFRQLIQ